MSFIFSLSELQLTWTFPLKIMLFFTDYKVISPLSISQCWICFIKSIFFLSFLTGLLAWRMDLCVKIQLASLACKICPPGFIRQINATCRCNWREGHSVPWPITTCEDWHSDYVNFFAVAAKNIPPKRSTDVCDVLFIASIASKTCGMGDSEHVCIIVSDRPSNEICQRYR